jgi:hypothetical protein
MTEQLGRCFFFGWVCVGGGVLVDTPARNKSGIAHQDVSAHGQSLPDQSTVVSGAAAACAVVHDWSLYMHLHRETLLFQTARDGVCPHAHL